VLLSLRSFGIGWIRSLQTHYVERNVPDVLRTEAFTPRGHSFFDNTIFDGGKNFFQVAAMQLVFVRKIRADGISSAVRTMARTAVHGGKDFLALSNDGYVGRISERAFVDGFLWL